MAIYCDMFTSGITFKTVYSHFEKMNIMGILKILLLFLEKILIITIGNRIKLTKNIKIAAKSN